MISATVLSNGVRIITEQLSGVRSVSLGIWVNAGSRNDPPRGSGIAHFTEHMLFKGTSRRSALQIAKEIDALGGHLNAQTAKEYTLYYTKVLDEHLLKASDILFDLFLNAEINPEELEKEKKVVLQEIRMTEDTPDDYITDLFAEAFFHDTPLGISILGSIDHVSAFNRDSIVDFIRTSYSPESIIVAGAGNLEHRDLVELATPLFHEIPKRSGRYNKQVSDRLSGARKVCYRDIEQVHFTLGATGSAMNDDRRWTYIVLNTILGGSMSSMLFQEAREVRGLVYSIYSYLNAYRDCGALAVYAACTPENVNRTLEVVSAQIARLKTGDIKDVSMEDIKTQIKGNLLLARESTVNRMSSMAKNEMYYGREVTMDEVIERIQAVSRDDVVDLAGEIFLEENLTLVALGRIKEEDLVWPPVS
ncbi:MAG TPA: pitrilysin family protein [Deltaproteobacteria bacterium]|jgi:predicted Zn-dependent peptidase|nr:insulinase family protein [Deltaproteobacteria bacterium]OQC25845.1 MAG: Protease 3 precursor [Deltaproteobacteria bacterium ADurb.Bin072]HRW79739.1 pitrilysin family protein [Desulfomonilia bacterium]NMD40456.1 insulinase family protein [Deltaproteobacteria bacterium]HNQ84744.1 pitrilysin family protein [Deltaproteobacteria bacterium]